MKTDIKNFEDIKLLVDTFYTKAMQDETIGFIFTNVAKIHLPTHLPNIYNFWNSVLFAEAGYKNNTIAKHIELHQKSPLLESHFAKWKELFFATVDDLFVGEIAELAKKRADAMIFLMKFKIEKSEEPGFIQ